MSVEYVLNAPLPKGAGLAKVTIDAEDIHLWCAHKWRVNGQGYVVTTVGRRQLFFHREVLKPAPGMVGDHINRTTLDNRRSNLRAVPQAHNVHNRARVNANNSSGYRGVWLNPRTGHFIAYGKISGKKVTVGYFRTAELANEAIVAWRAANYAGLVPGGNP